jgi:hypothetical protein
MAVEALIDAGAMLAILDKSDHWHRACIGAIQQLRLPLVTSEAVLTEFFHLIGRREMNRAWQFVRSGILEVAPILYTELPNIQGLMTQYSDRPMDFADATLVHLAKRERLTTVFTVDHADFHTYRIDGRKRFRIVPEHRI